jgi:DNA-binding winged helix-turn-helix (wHTH) protein/tetratricopeptide (TPR) repeat protein
MRPTASAQTVIHFGVFEADLRAGELRKNGTKVKIQELPFRALSLLLSRPNEVFSRDDFRQTLWPEDVYVDFDRGITSAINRLREALGDSADNPVFIETVGRRGYRWIAPTHFLAKLATPAVVPVVVQPAPPHTPARWKFMFVVPVLALLFAAWIFRPSYRSAKADPSPQSRASSLTPGLARHAANREAEELYLNGRFFWNKRTPESLNKAVDSFTQAIVHDPDYAPAYVGLADCYNLLREYSSMPGVEAYARAFAAAKKAVELDDQSSEAHASLAFVSFYGMWDTVTAGREFQRAIELNPDNAKAHHWYATYLMSLRRFPQSLDEMERAQALDPHSSSILADKGLLLWRMGRRDEALRLLKQLEVAEPEFLSPHRYLKYIYLDQSDYPGYLLELRQDAVLTHNSAALVVADAAEKGFKAGGSRSMLKHEFEEEKKLYGRGQFPAYSLAMTSAAQGDKAAAIMYLRDAFAKHGDGIVQMEIDSLYDTLKDEPAFRQIVAEAGLPQL